MAKYQFDELDCKILRFLADNARKPFLEIARECNISGAAVHQRIQKLTAQGVIRGYETLINPASLGYSTCAYIGFFLANPTQLEQVAAELRRVDEVVEVHYTTGRYDLLVKLYARNNEHLLQVIHESLQSISSGRTETLISFREEFSRQVPINIDNLD